MARHLSEGAQRSIFEPAAAASEPWQPCFASHKVAVPDVESGTFRPTGRDMLIGQFPYTVTVTADGRWGLAGSEN